METSLPERGQIKKELITFLVITFGATYLFEFLMYGVAGPYTDASRQFWNPSLPAAMVIPALSAILCMVYLNPGR